jgi:hypothetical protein
LEVVVNVEGKLTHVHDFCRSNVRVKVTVAELKGHLVVENAPEHATKQKDANGQVVRNALSVAKRRTLAANVVN